MLHSISMMDLVGDSERAIKKENKKKLHKLLDKYGSVEAIEQNGDMRDSFELDFARIDGALDEVLRERRLGYREPKSGNNDTLKSSIEQSNSLLSDDEYFSLEGLTLSDKQRKAISKLDMVNQLAVIRALREQQGVEKPKPKTKTSPSELEVLREKVEKANRELKVADNEYAGTKSDVNIERGKKEKNNKDNYKLGTLSSIYEAKGNPAIIGEDNAGGPSYGRYQIATKTGTMAKYINFLSKSSKYSKYSKLLNEAGGEEGALQRTNDFENMWIKLSKNEEFNQSQHDFIIDTHLKPLITAVKEKHILN